MFDLPIRSVMERKKFITAAPTETVSTAARMMATHDAGAVLIVQDHQLIGIFTERDVVFRVIALGRDPKATVLQDVMTADPKTLGPTQCYGHALVIMQENGFRHVPVVENGHAIGIISSRNAMDPDLEEFVADQRRREHYR
ncbi:MAG: inosine-5-monophosphate dehydrogenase [Betaproteobacteria bacterium HGW-Betaproteobacteria-18]|nr:MAG: inosine-5-monophosphate dehydrogenase [Betaproteobacteria bacterium HGW-Betaproteobacteria-18]